MRVLWISNIIFPEVCKELNVNVGVVGGWMQSGASSLIENNKDIELAVISFYKGDKLRIIDKFRIRYYLIPKSGNLYDKKLEAFYRRVVGDYQPDIVHVHGSENTHSAAFVRACGNKNVVVSIQGLVSIYANYYLGGISLKEVRRNISLRDILRADTLICQQRNMAARGDYEIELIKNVRHIIGRTSWDRSCCWAINPDAKFHLCNETLRDSFYKNTWNYDSCKKHSIFLSQAHYPIKGIHKLIEALPIILREFSDTEVYVAGPNLMKRNLFQNGFACYVRQLMEKTSTIEHLNFLGPLSEEDMVTQYLKANVFVCPSAIENSPNSVGEAQLLGVPCIGSYVGGTMDMITDGETGFLYRFEETALLAMRVCEIFRSRDLCERLSANERVVAAKRHNKLTNSTTLRAIYNNILKND